ncbi:MAG TPA: DUF1015 domain-containing protein [Rhodospirillaceae bacterium]|nr:DUF1015 domain-containing protein [Rhodospirillaceae bacterium]
MNLLIRPFRGLRPVPEKAADVLAPPYDVLNTEEARKSVIGKPYSFLHISKPEIDLPPETSPFAPEVYAKGAENLAKLLADGILIREEGPVYYIYRLRMGEHTQTGIVAVTSVLAYDTNRVRKHEHTRPEKEDDRVRQIDALNAQTGPVLLAYKANKNIQNLIDGVASGAPLCEVTASDGIIHTMWIMNDPSAIEHLTKLIDNMDALYIADGHHRSAAASRVAAARRNSQPQTDSHEYFLTVAFAHDQTNILDYNRVIRDLGGLTDADFLAKVREYFKVKESGTQVVPNGPGCFGMYLAGKWYQLEVRPQFIPKDDPVARLDVSLLQNNLINPILKISDPRRDKRIDFVGGIRGLGELERRVNSGEMKGAFVLFPTSMEQLIAVADAGGVMPPKSTWFEPKLADGLVSHVLD